MGTAGASAKTGVTSASSSAANATRMRAERRMPGSEIRGRLRQEDFPVLGERGERDVVVQGRVKLGRARHEVALQFEQPVSIDVEAKSRRHVVLVILTT